MLCLDKVLIRKNVRNIQFLMNLWSRKLAGIEGLYIKGNQHNQIYLELKFKYFDKSSFKISKYNIEFHQIFPIHGFLNSFGPKNKYEFLIWGKIFLKAGLLKKFLKAKYGSCWNLNFHYILYFIILSLNLYFLTNIII